MKTRVRMNYYLGLSLVVLSLLLGLGSLNQCEIASAHVVRAAPSSQVQRKHYWGKVIVVSLSQQWLTAYKNDEVVYSTAVLTGRAALPTPLGTYHIFSKRSPVTFHSPFPKKSPYWYPPTHINYAMEWKAGGYYLHDSWWHTVYGAGTNGEHYDPTYGWQQGSHGCVSMPKSAAAWLYKWAPIGTTVKIVP